MKDQVQNLEERGYTRARTINSDISPIVRDEILDSVASGKCDILYLSPESLLSRSDVEQLIGKRKIGMLVVDESHIVTTWGKAIPTGLLVFGRPYSETAKAASLKVKAIPHHLLLPLLLQRRFRVETKICIQ